MNRIPQRIVPILLALSFATPVAAGSLRLLTWNSTGLNQDKLASILKEAEAHKIDIVLLQKANTKEVKNLKPQGPYRLTIVEPEGRGGRGRSYAVYQHEGVGIQNKGTVPYQEPKKYAPDWEVIAGRTPQHLVVKVGDAFLRLFNWHAPQPENYATASLRESQLAAKTLFDGTKEVVLLVGDLNMAREHVPGQRLHSKWDHMVVLGDTASSERSKAAACRTTAATTCPSVASCSGSQSKEDGGRTNWRLLGFVSGVQGDLRRPRRSEVRLCQEPRSSAS